MSDNKRPYETTPEERAAKFRAVVRDIAPCLTDAQVEWMAQQMEDVAEELYQATKKGSSDE